MKKILIITAVIFILSLSSCFRNDEKEETTGTTTTAATTTETSVTAAAPPAQIITITSAPVPEAASTNDYGSRIVSTAEALIGIDFANGGASPSEGFDNSGFIYYVLRENGYISCPRQISGQLEWGENTDYNGIKAGDVVYFSDEVGGEASFGGIYAGNGTMIYSPYPGEKVKTADITTEYWKSRFATALSL